MSDLPLALRPAVDDDTPFLISAWMRHHVERWKAFAKREPHFAHLAVFDDIRPGVLRLLKVCTVSVACHPEHTDQIYGFAVHELAAFHFIYVKPPFRRMGVATALVAAGSPSRVATALPWWPMPAEWTFRPQLVSQHGKSPPGQVHAIGQHRRAHNEPSPDL